jgi:hypothetical protein
MSKIQCPDCREWRTVEQVCTPEGWDNAPCGNCGDPGWTQPYDSDDPLAGRGSREGAPR